MRKLIIHFGILALVVLAGCEKDASVGPQTGVGGSMARFAITDNFLYIVSHKSLEVYSISDPGNPKKSVSKPMGFGIETIFPYRNNLFIGSTEGMYIYENKNPAEPVLLSRYTHLQSCDPVVVQGDYAYVTLRGGATCRTGNTASTLDVVDISNLSSPKIAFSQALESPYGLGVSDNRLFVCEGDKGFKVFDLDDKRMPVLKRSYPNIPAYDVIVRNSSSLIVTGKNGLYQYGFSNVDNDLTELSILPVGGK